MMYQTIRGISNKSKKRSLGLAANRKHDLVALQVYDKMDVALPQVGLMKILDSETGEDMWIATSSKKVREEYHDHYQKQLFEVQQAFTKSRINNVSMNTDQD